ncbi:Hsp20/alpha crystallin family protein [Pararobbsia silviterrae]|uniref:Hsp20/alpha crystallin family protein n=1 Tax=Pararobbsia silviterrae TaxID=1792498 RepID=A0A494Y6W6_9BURK|nr:Hsp20/alpha crystallin family protein [Pararobbsia silviterrae]RKP55670.1 Hsp20/alpha crystallin family protein [Pararobbsia silviterrae]
MSSLYYGTDLLNEFDRLQRHLSTVFGGAPTSLRSTQAGAYPAVNVGSTDDSIEVVAFVPGIDPSKLDVSIDKGVLTIAGERARPDAATDAKHYARERFSGAFRRVIELPQYADPDKVQARYTDGCLLISIGKREASKPRAITIQ